MKNLLRIVALATMVAGGCSKKEPPAGSGTASATATVPATAPDAAAAPATPDPSAAAPARADVAAFTALFGPIHGRLDHVSRARTACEQRAPLLEAAGAIDKTTPPAGRDAQAWLAGVQAVQAALDEMGEPCDEGNIKAIEAKVDAAKAALDALGT